MSHNAPHSLPTPQPAPWRDEFLDHVQKTPEFALSTVCREPVWNIEQDPHQPWHQRHTIEPRVRFCVCRGMIGAAPPPFPLPNGEARMSESPPETPPPAASDVPDVTTQPAAPQPLFKTDCPVFTTDDRMRKPGQLRANPAVEAAWWCKPAGVQWRVRGVARIISAVAEREGPGNDDGEGGTTAARGASAELEAVEAQLAAVREAEARDALEARMYDVEGDLSATARWSWETEVAAWFAAQSPGIRGSFKSPPPGRPVSEGCPPGLEVGLQLAQQDLSRDPVARRNFRVVAICPVEVERTDLSDPREARRTLWAFDERWGTWSETLLWP